MKKRYFITTLLSILCCVLALCGSLMLTGCDEYESYFNNKTSDYTLDNDYVMKDDDTTSFTSAVTLDLNGRALDLNGNVFNVNTQGEEQITLTNGTIKNGSIYISAAKSTILFKNLTIDSSIESVTINGNATFENVIGQDVKVDGGFLTITSAKSIIDGGEGYVYSDLSQLDNITVSEDALYESLTIGSNVVIGNIYLKTSSSLNLSGIVANVVSTADGSYVLANSGATIGNVYIGGKNTVVEYKDGAQIGGSYITSDAKKSAIKYNAEFASIDTIEVPAYKIVELKNLCSEVKTYVEYSYDDGKSPKTIKLDIAKCHHYGEAESIIDSELIGHVYEYTCLDCGSHIREIEDPDRNIVECDNFLEALLLFVPDFNIDYSLDPGMSLSLGGMDIVVNEGYIHIVAQDGIINGVVLFDGVIGDEAKSYKAYMNNYTAYYLTYATLGEGEEQTTRIDSVNTIDFYDYLVELLGQQFFGYDGEQLETLKNEIDTYFDYFKTGIDISKTVIANADDFINVAVTKLLEIYNIIVPEGLIEKLNPLGLFFTADGNTYTMNLENVCTLMEGSVRNLIDGLYGEETVSRLVDYLANDLPNKTVGEFADDVIAFAKECNMDSEKIFSTINLIVDYINYIKAEDTSTLSPFDIEKVIEEQYDLSLNSKSIEEIQVVKNIKAFLQIDNLNDIVDKLLYEYYDEFLASSFGNTTYSTIKHNLVKWNTQNTLVFTMVDDSITFIDFDRYDVKKIEDSQNAEDEVPYDKYQISEYAAYSLDYIEGNDSYELTLIKRDDTTKEDSTTICSLDATSTKADVFVDMLNGSTITLDYDNVSNVETLTVVYDVAATEEAEAANYTLIDYIKNSEKETLLIDLIGQADIKYEVIKGITEVSVDVEHDIKASVKYGDKYYALNAEFGYEQVEETYVAGNVLNFVYDEDNEILFHYNEKESIIIDLVDNIEVGDKTRTEDLDLTINVNTSNIINVTYDLIEAETYSNEIFTLVGNVEYNNIKYYANAGIEEYVVILGEDNKSTTDRIYLDAKTNEITYKFEYGFDVTFTDCKLINFECDVQDFFSEESDKEKVDENTKFYHKILVDVVVKYDETYGYIHDINVEYGHGDEDKVSTFTMKQEIVEAENRLDTHARLYFTPYCIDDYPNSISLCDYEFTFDEEYNAEKQDECKSLTVLIKTMGEIYINNVLLDGEIYETYDDSEKVIKFDFNYADKSESYYYLLYEVVDEETQQHISYKVKGYNSHAEANEIYKGVIYNSSSHKACFNATLTKSSLDLDLKSYNYIDRDIDKTLELLEQYYADTTLNTFKVLGDKDGYYKYYLNCDFNEDYLLPDSIRTACYLYPNNLEYCDIDYEFVVNANWDAEGFNVKQFNIDVIFDEYNNSVKSAESEQTMCEFFVSIDYVNNDNLFAFNFEYGEYDEDNTKVKEIISEQTGYIDHYEIVDNQKFLSIIVTATYDKTDKALDAKFIVGGKQAEKGKELGYITYDPSTLTYYTDPLTLVEIKLENNKFTIYDRITGIDGLIDSISGSDEESVNAYELFVNNIYTYQNDNLVVNEHYVEKKTLSDGTDVYHIHFELAKDTIYDESITEDQRTYRTLDAYLEILDISTEEETLFTAYAYFYQNGILTNIYQGSDSRIELFRINYTNTDELLEIIVDKIMNYDGFDNNIESMLNSIGIEVASLKIDKIADGKYSFTAYVSGKLFGNDRTYNIHFLDLEFNDQYVLINIPAISLDTSNSAGFEGLRIKLYNDGDLLYADIHYGQSEYSIIDFILSLDASGKLDVQLDFKGMNLNNLGIHINNNCQRSLESFEDVFKMTQKEFSELEVSPK